MDDLDSDLFGSLMKPKNRSAQPQKGKIKPHSTVFDEDDPLAGLLSDEEDKPTSKQKGSGNAEKRKTDTFASATSLLPDSPPAQSGRRSFLDNLLAKSDVAAASSENRQQEFVLSSKYQTPQTQEAVDSDRGSQVNKSTEDFQFGGYVPSSASNQRVEQRRPATALPSNLTSAPDVKTFGYTPATESGSNLSVPRTSRRGIQPTTTTEPNAFDNDLSIVPTRLSSSAHSDRRNSADWLELKTDAAPGSSSSVRERRTTELNRDVDWLGSKNEAIATTPQPRAVQSEARAESIQEPKNDNFMDWLGAPKTKEAVEQRQIETTASAKPSNFVQQTKPTVPTISKTSPGFDISNVNSGTQNKQESNVILRMPEISNSIATQIEYDGKLAHLKTQMAEIHTKYSEESLSVAVSTLDLQTKVRHLEFERDQLKRSLEGLESRYKEEVDALELSFKKRTQLVEDSYQRREKRLQDELETLLQDQVDREKHWDRERSNVISNWQRRLDESTRERMDDLERARELQQQSVGQMKKDHDMAIARLQQIKKLEVDAMNEAHSHSRTLQLVIEQLKSNTTELGILQSKVNDNHGSEIDERQVMFEIKERQLKLVQDQLNKQREENCQERATLRQLISSLEERLQKQSLVQEEERWKINQEMNQLELDKKTFMAMKKSESEQITKSQQLLNNAKKAFMDEQNAIMQRIYNEKRIPLSPRMDNDVFQQSYVHSSEPLVDSFSILKARAELDSNLKFVEDERKNMELGKSKLKLEMEQVLNDRAMLERRQSELEDERTAINALALKVKQRSEEVEEMCMAAVKTREEGFATMQESKKQQYELSKHQEVLDAKLETLKRKERQLAEERTAITRKQKELDHLSSKLLCVQCQVPLYQDAMSNQNRMPDRSGIGGSLRASPWIPQEVDHTLMAWHLAAEQDKKYLERESLYLQNLQTAHL